MKRRHLLAGLTTLITWLAGCTPDYPSYKRLDIGSTEVEKQDGEWMIRLSVENRNTMSGEQADFHEVRLVGFDEERELVCKKSIGTVQGRQTVQQMDVTVKCNRFPEILTFDAAESPCHSEVQIVILFFSRVEDGEYVWDATNSRQCKEGLPPEFRD